MTKYNNMYNIIAYRMKVLHMDLIKNQEAWLALFSNRIGIVNNILTETKKPKLLIIDFLNCKFSLILCDILNNIFVLLQITIIHGIRIRRGCELRNIHPRPRGVKYHLRQTPDCR